MQILSACWGLFSHILQRDKGIPANKAIKAYFIPTSNKLQGRPKTTLPIVFNRFLTLIQVLTSNQAALKQRPDLIHRPSTGDEMLEGTSKTDRRNCQRVTDEELGRSTAIRQSGRSSR